MKRRSDLSLSKPNEYNAYQLLAPADTKTQHTGGAQHRLALELPKDIGLLRSHSGTIEHLQLTLLPTTPWNEMDIEPWEELESCVIEALARCPLLSSLSILCEANAPVAFLNKLNAQIANKQSPLPSLKLFLKEPSILDSKDSANSECLLDLLCRLKPSDAAPALTIEVLLTDIDDPHVFIDSLLAAGVSDALLLTVSGCGGDTVNLQQRLDELQRAHLDRVVHRFAPNGHLNCAELLQYCRELEAGGPQLFAWACSAAASTDVDQWPQVPIHLSGYLRALHSAGVSYTVSCVLPVDAQALVGCDKALIASLAIDFGRMADGDGLLPAIAGAMGQMQSATTCNVYHEAAEPAFGDWLCRQLMAMPLERLRLNLGGGEAEDFSSPAADLLIRKPSLQMVICVDTFAASLFVHSAEQLDQEGLDLKCPALGLDLTPETAGQVVLWLDDLHWPRLKLNLNVVADRRPDAFLENFSKQIEQMRAYFTLAWLRVAWGPQMTGFNALLATAARRDIGAIMLKLESSDRAAKPLETKPQPIVEAMVDSFALHDSNGQDVHQRQRILAAKQLLKNPLNHLTDLLSQNAIHTLSGLNRQTRQHFGNLEVRQLEAAVLWVRQQTRLKFGEAHYRPILLALFGEQQTRRILQAAR